jgi:hypothetical protein
MATMNKRVLISESHGDSNRCTLCRGKPLPTRHVRFPHQSTYARRTLHVGGPRTWQPFTLTQQSWTDSLLPRKKYSRLHLPARLSGPWDPPQFLFQHSHWSSALKPNICRQHATRFTGLISPACDQYVQYLLTGTNPSILNRHSRGLSHRKSRNNHTTLSVLPFRGFHWSV